MTALLNLCIQFPRKIVLRGISVSCSVAVRVGERIIVGVERYDAATGKGTSSSSKFLLLAETFRFGGIETILDESLDKLLVAMETFPNVAVLGDAVGLARIIGLCLALCVGSYECWMMMLGRRGMDVMKLLRIVGISICISCSSWICSALQTPGKGLEAATKAMAKSKNKEVAAFELKVAQKQSEYLERLRAVQDSLSQPHSRLPLSERTQTGGTN